MPAANKRIRMIPAGKVALIIIFNHRFDKNIPVLEELYLSRFSAIFHLVPFYDGDKPNVIAVYESSFYFQGYISQGFKSFFSQQFEHYIFVADDMILNPNINEHNYQEVFSLSKESSFIPELFTLNNYANNETLRFHPHVSFKDRILSQKHKKPKKLLWNRTSEAIQYDPQKEGVEGFKELPSYDAALNIIRDHGIDLNPVLEYDDVHSCPAISIKDISDLFTYAKGKIQNKTYTLRYPVVASYSDLVIVSADAIKRFVQYCGVFAATELFVEFAIPTALLLSSRKVITEPALSKRGLIYWVYTDKQKEIYERDMMRYDYNLQQLIKNFPADKLYIHPVKLSRWRKAES